MTAKEAAIIAAFRKAHAEQVRAWRRAKPYQRKTGLNGKVYRWKKEADNGKTNRP